MRGSAAAPPPSSEVNELASLRDPPAAGSLTSADSVHQGGLPPLRFRLLLPTFRWKSSGSHLLTRLRLPRSARTVYPPELRAACCTSFTRVRRLGAGPNSCAPRPGNAGPRSLLRLVGVSFKRPPRRASAAVDVGHSALLPPKNRVRAGSSPLVGRGAGRGSLLRSIAGGFGVRNGAGDGWGRWRHECLLASRRVRRCVRATHIESRASRERRSCSLRRRAPTRPRR